MCKILDAIRQAIEESEETQYRISKGAGIYQGTLSRFMSGESDLKVDTVERLAEHLGLEIEIRPKRRSRKRR